MPRTIRVSADQRQVFVDGLARIRAEHDVPESFPTNVLAEAQSAAAKPLGRDHVDRTDLPFVTLDPAASTDLDQAFTIERGTGERGAGEALLLHYAIADVAWFVQPGGAMEAEAFQRGVTVYLPDGRAPVYPPQLSEGAASLLPTGPRPAVLLTIRVDALGETSLEHVQRVVIRSRAKLGYEHAVASDLPAAFAEFAVRIQSAEERRGASRVDTPQQEVVADDAGGYRVEFRPRLANEDTNAALSLATNLAVAGVLLRAGTGLFRVMPDPDEDAVRRLRFTARALGLDWDPGVTLRAYQRQLRRDDPKHAAFLIAVRRATGGAAYAGFRPGVVPWHSAMAATYSHATAPLRRVADRYVIEAALALVNGREVAPHVQSAFDTLPDVMDRAENRAATIDRAIIDLVESVTLMGHEGQTFDAVVTDVDGRGARFQLCDLAVTSRVGAHHVDPGDDIRVRLVAADPVRRQISFERVG